MPLTAFIGPALALGLDPARAGPKPPPPVAQALFIVEKPAAKSWRIVPDPQLEARVAAKATERPLRIVVRF